MHRIKKNLKTLPPRSLWFSYGEEGFPHIIFIYFLFIFIFKIYLFKYTIFCLHVTYYFLKRLFIFNFRCKWHFACMRVCVMVLNPPEL